MAAVCDAHAVADRIRFCIRLMEEQAPATIGEALRFELLSWDEGKGEAVLSCRTAEWMRNALNTLHGGMIATVLDHGMALVASAIPSEVEITPTVEMQISYHKPILIGDDLRIAVQILSVSSKLTHIAARIYSGNEMALCASSTGIYYFKNKLKNFLKN